MALFERKNKKTKDATPKKEVTKSEKESGKSSSSLSRPVILGPKLTEKAILLNDESVYVFEVSRDSSKTEIKEAIKKLYKVTPVAVNVLARPTKTKRRRQGVGRTAKGRKAYVTLKKGDTIDIA